MLRAERLKGDCERFVRWDVDSRPGEQSRALSQLGQKTHDCMKGRRSGKLASSSVVDRTLTIEGVWSIDF